MHWKISGGHNETVRRNGRSSWGSQPASVWKSPKRRISGDLIEGTNSNESFPPSIFMMLKNHLDIIGRNEPIQRKARFWQSYVRALKGTDDMRAHDRVSSRPRGVFRPLLSDFPELSSGWPYSKSIYDEPIHAVDRISVPGYRYLPVSRETYGYSPRNLYPAPYGGVRGASRNIQKHCNAGIGVGHRFFGCCATNSRLHRDRESCFVLKQLKVV
ncbi:hypothetical protein L798_12140 [Zootermopsis nevadensis]|uniref:Uncharacterized protein n=1 Tax=Zootermopsis nevadensis TaxID=136037 RepID=A0A067QUT9_ZOONE|nr:hypothetical protein L798_12140 [Zootermopsis nevadensis]